MNKAKELKKWVEETQDLIKTNEDDKGWTRVSGYIVWLETTLKIACNKLNKTIAELQQQPDLAKIEGLLKDAKRFAKVEVEKPLDYESSYRLETQRRKVVFKDIDQALQLLWQKEKCETCGGTGGVCDDEDLGGDGVTHSVCPDCKGTGYDPKT